MKNRWRISLLLACILSLGVMAAPAEAGTPCGHCYSIARSSTATFGRLASLYVVPGHIDNFYTPGHFIDQELWVWGSVAGTWVEVGFTYGYVDNQANVGPSWYWADNRPGNVYYEHIPGYPNPANYYNQYVPVGAAYLGLDTWGIYIGGTYQGLSVGLPGISAGSDTGLEVKNTGTNDYLNTSLSSVLKWQDYLGGWHDGFLTSSLDVQAPLYGAWYINDYYWVDAY
jgi:hypothetical protein